MHTSSKFSEYLWPKRERERERMIFIIISSSVVFIILLDSCNHLMFDLRLLMQIFISAGMNFEALQGVTFIGCV